MRFKTASPDETKKLGQALGSLLKKGDILLIYGELGAGKTIFTQGLAIGMGIKAHITSPTFTIIHEYPGTIPLYHIDAYRLDKEEEILELGLEEYLYGEGVTAIEWPEKLDSWLPEEVIEISIKKIDGQENKRELTFAGQDKRGFGELMEELKKNVHISH